MLDVTAASSKVNSISFNEFNWLGLHLQKKYTDFIAKELDTDFLSLQLIEISMINI